LKKKNRKKSPIFNWTFNIIQIKPLRHILEAHYSKVLKSVDGLRVPIINAQGT
jgi:hypothetical protein